MESQRQESIVTKIEILAWRTHGFVSDKIGFLFQKYVISEFKIGVKAIKSIGDSFDFSQNFRSLWFNKRPMQDKTEFIEFELFLRSKGVKLLNIMEIGTANGGTLFLFSQIAEPGGAVVSIDKYNFPNWKKSLFRLFSDKVKIVLIKGSSIDQKVVDNIKAQIGNIKLDLLFIDADHTYFGVKRDFNCFASFVKEGG